MMELDNQQQPNPMKVMTDEQLETLRKQIAIYATICERLVEMHKTLTSQQDLAAELQNRFSLGFLSFCLTLVLKQLSFHLSLWSGVDKGGRMVSLYADPRTPSKQKIKDLTEELSQHGQIAEQNICNWFQNRRARSKRKQHCGVGSSNNKNGEGEVETETETLNEKRKRPESLFVVLPDGNNNNVIGTTTTTSPRPEDLCFQSPEMSSDLHLLGVQSNPRDEHLVESYNLYDHVEDYDMSG
ncbi:hypothetical protein F2Q70_00013039 [Brassica cretica]|uniref:Homeobox domain-containing protein n=1 Tax=Brassica cretica TaxID=69181 RepID=A0A8S9M3V6_BRACR|nr:hypothetical protein F2Q70_00013039 [Brassica cretica]KAF3549809.1 hypothetical protein DY000_02009445 [Brassica cretica]